MLRKQFVCLLLLALSTVALAKFKIDPEKMKEIEARGSNDALDVLYSCDFDTNDCDLEFDDDDLIDDTPKFTVDKTLLTNSGYLISDYSSITKPASDGELCQVPFNLNNKTYFHCTEDNKCHTPSGIATCNSGSFLNGKFNTPEHRNTMYKAIFSYTYENMLYELSFAALLYCEGEKDCEKSNDIIQVGIYGESDGEQVKQFKAVKMSDFNRAKSWQKFSLQLNGINKINFLEIVVLKDFYSQVKSTTYYGVDDIKIKFVERYDQVYHCNFDKDDCEFSFDDDVFKHVAIRPNIIVGSNVFTDFTSTNDHTSNFLQCSIPYYDNGKIRYHCNADNQCETKDGLATCSQGRFLGGFTNNSVDGSFIERTSTVVFVPEASRRYLLSYQVFMYCEGRKEDCDKSTDYILIYVNNGQGMLGEQLLKLKDFGGRQGWMKVMVDLPIERKAFFLNWEIGRFSYNNATTFFGIDEFKVFIVSQDLDEYTTTTTTTTTTATTTTVKTTTVPVTTTTTTTTTPTTTTTTTPTTSTTTTTAGSITLGGETSQSNLGVILPAVLVPSLVLLFGAIIGYMFYSKKGCFGKSNKVDPNEPESIEL